MFVAAVFQGFQLLLQLANLSRVVRVVLHVVLEQVASVGDLVRELHAGFGPLQLGIASLRPCLASTGLWYPPRHLALKMLPPNASGDALSAQTAAANYSAN